MKNETKNEKLTVYDGVLAVLYLIIIAFGIFMCINHGLGGTVVHLAVITACIWGVLATKLLKYRTEIRDHLGELVFIAVMSIAAVITLVGTLM